MVELVAADHGGRRARLRERLDEHDLPALLVTHLVNVRYLTGFTGSNGALLVGPDDDHTVLFTDGRYEAQADEQVPDLAHDIGRGSLAERALDRVAAATLAFEGDWLSYAIGAKLLRTARDKGLDLTPTAGHVEALRMVKDEHELMALMEACSISDAVFRRLTDHLEPGLTERDVARFVDRTGEDLGSDGPSFETIVASGPNGGKPHHRPTERRLEHGDLVTIDFGALVAGYHADTTRTVAIGWPDDELARIHDVVREAQRAGRDAAIDGATVGDVDRAARQVIERAGFGERFVHPTGHALGLEVHEQPTVAAEGTATLCPNVALTVEPGIYLPGVGGVRIEDTVVVTPTGPSRSLTDSPRELLVL